MAAVQSASPADVCDEVRLQIITSAFLKAQVCQIVTLCLCVSITSRFENFCCLLLQGHEVLKEQLILVRFFDAEVEGATIIRTVADHTPSDKNHVVEVSSLSVL
jgi:hypothetical protein